MHPREPCGPIWDVRPSFRGRPLPPPSPPPSPGYSQRSLCSSSPSPTDGWGRVCSGVRDGVLTPPTVSQGGSAAKWSTRSGRRMDRSPSLTNIPGTGSSPTSPHIVGPGKVQPNMLRGHLQGGPSSGKQVGGGATARGGANDSPLPSRPVTDPVTSPTGSSPPCPRAVAAAPRNPDAGAHRPVPIPHRPRWT